MRKFWKEKKANRTVYRVEKVSQLEKEPLNYSAWSIGCQITKEKESECFRCNIVASHKTHESGPSMVWLPTK
jgi:invasion protein IalB